MTESPLDESLVTITDSSSLRSPGGPHDYFSEGDYWWPNPENPSGPYVRRDGHSNPDNFDGHRRALRRFSTIVPALAVEWLRTGNRAYADKAAEHLHAWFTDPTTKMNPHMLYSQAIRGICTGRDYGIIDSVHLAEVIRAASVLRVDVRPWVTEFLSWLTTHEYGLRAKFATNNLAAAWTLQVLECARYVDDEASVKQCRRMFTDQLLAQVDSSGAFPLERRRTRPYSYSLFNLDLLATICQVLDMWSEPKMAKAIAFHYPFVVDKFLWDKPDVAYWEFWPAKHPAFYFAGNAYRNVGYVELWNRLSSKDHPEVVRNTPVRQPQLWG